MEFVVDSPVIRWFLDLDWEQMVEIQSPWDLYFNFLPVLSTVFASIAVGFICKRAVEDFNVVLLQLACGLVGPYLFLRYVWFHGFIHFRRLCYEYLDIEADFCRRFMEPGLAAVVAMILRHADRLLKRAKRVDAEKKTSEIGLGKIDSRGDGVQDNSNNSASGVEHRGSSLDDLDDTMYPFGLHLYCQRCGQVVYESVGDPFPPPLAPLTRPSIPKALVMSPNGASPLTTLRRCPNCIEKRMNAAGLRGVVHPKNVSFTVGPHNLPISKDPDQTRNKSILREPY